jgi:hypothetical protein
VLPWAAIGLFHHSHREDYSGIDVKITYALLCTAVLEYFSQLVFVTAVIDMEHWPEMVAQYNITEYLVRYKNHSNMMWIASKSGCRLSRPTLVHGVVLLVQHHRGVGPS